MLEWANRRSCGIVLCDPRILSVEIGCNAPKSNKNISNQPHRNLKSHARLSVGWASSTAARWGLAYALLAACNAAAAVPTSAPAETAIPQPAAVVPVSALDVVIFSVSMEGYEKVTAGAGSRQLDASGVAGVSERWCVEVTMTKDSQPARAAVEVALKDAALQQWVSSTPLYGSDCSAIK